MGYQSNGPAADRGPAQGARRIHVQEIAVMNTYARKLRSLNLDSGTHRRRVGECQAGAARLGGAEGANHALKIAYWTLAVVLALSSSWVHAQTPTCAAPGCNSVASDGFGNTAAGSSTLTHLIIIPTHTGGMTGSDNTASGFQALFSNTTGGGNTASGFQALLANTTGDDNTASGGDALRNNTTGTQNTASGAAALQNNTTGDYNTALGSQTLALNTTGGGNTASGAFALFDNTT